MIKRLRNHFLGTRDHSSNALHYKMSSANNKLYVEVYSYRSGINLQYIVSNRMHLLISIMVEVI